ncbi:MAG TPA: response regulator [Gemmatimonadales bacterium]|nr:response regulator [Gemmatimonadales bacterium]
MSTLPPPCVLVVEPEPMLRRTITKVLQDAGYRVIAVPGVPASPTPGPGEARPQLIVLGTRLLDAEFAATAHRLRVMEPSAPILAVADEVDPRYTDPSLLPQGSRCLAPPFDLPDLLRAVQSQLDSW